MITFKDYRAEWLNDILTNDETERRNLFARKILSDWLDIDTSSENFVEFDANNVINIAYLHEEVSDDNNTETIWYLAKYIDANKISEKNADAEITKLKDLFSEKHSIQDYNEFSDIQDYIRKSNEQNKIALIYCFDGDFTDEVIEFVSAVQKAGRNNITPFFYADFVNIEIIFERVLEQEKKVKLNKFTFKANTNQAGSLYVGSISLLDLFDFMKKYENQINDIDRLYEKNIRRYLGSRRQVNKGIKRTILLNPANFGLFNNGITIVATNTSNKQAGSIDLTEPFIVNGAQTTKTLWETFDTGCIENEDVWQKLVKKAVQRINPKPNIPLYQEWKDELENALVVVKIAETDENDSQSIREITKYTNSQTAVTAKDFLAVNDDFNNWQELMSEKYKIYLEIQRGGWISQKAKQATQPNIKPFFKDNEWVNAFDLVKVFAAGWLGEVGSAFGKTPPFSPGGTVFKEIINNQTHDDLDKTIHIKSFGVNDLYACYLLHQKTINDYKFGRNADANKKTQRGSTRYLFYYTVIKIVKDILLNTTGIETAYQTDNITKAFMSLFEPANQEALNALMDTAAQIVDEYLTEGTEDNIFQDPQFKDYDNNLNRILKSPMIGKTVSYNNIFAVNVRVMKRFAGGIKPYDMIAEIIKNHSNE
jgi:hypothetical protein